MSEKAKRLLLFAYTSLMAMWFFGFVVWLIKLGVQHHLLVFQSGSELALATYASFYSCGTIIFSPDRTHLYDLMTQWKHFNAVIAPLHTEIVPGIHSVPWLVLLMAPFALVPMEPSFALWNIFCCAVGIAGMVSLLRYLKYDDPKLIAVMLLSWAAWFPSGHAIKDGQPPWLYTGIIAWFCRYWLDRKNLPCGVMLGLLSLKPQYLPFLGLGALLQKRWKVIVFSAVTVAALVALSALVIGWDAILAYPRFMWEGEKRLPWVPGSWTVSIRGPLTLLIGYQQALTVSSIIEAITLLALIPMWWRTDDELRRQKLALAVTLVVSLVMNNHVMFYDLTQLAPPVVLAMSAFSDGKNGASRTALRVWTGLFIAYGVLGCLLFVVFELLPLFNLLAITYFALDVVIAVVLIYFAVRTWRDD